jgi:hypothetical protein
MGRFLGLIAVSTAAVLMSGCDVDVQDPGELPEVDVDAQPGEMPEVDVEGPDVDVSSEQEEVTVPDVDVEMEEKEVTVPDVNVDAPN